MTHFQIIVGVVKRTKVIVFKMNWQFIMANYEIVEIIAVHTTKFDWHYL